MVKGLRVPATPQQERLVVLPFVNVGCGPTQQPYGDGLIETVSSKLCQFREFSGFLAVIPASDIRERNVNSASQAHRQFGATLAVTGSMQWQGDHLRLTLNLVDARTLRQLRSCVQDYPVTTGSAFQDGIALKLAEMLRLELQTSARKAPSKSLHGAGSVFRWNRRDARHVPAGTQISHYRVELVGAGGMGRSLLPMISLDRSVA
jgi:TolB-like protein